MRIKRAAFLLSVLLFAGAGITRAASFDPLHFCIAQNKFWDYISKKCVTPPPDKPVEETRLMPGCAWMTDRFTLDAIQHIDVTFRYQACPNASVHYLFDLATGVLFKNTINPTNRVAEFRDYAPGNLVTMIQRINAPTLKKDEELDCDVIYHQGLRGYLYMPNRYYLLNLTLGPQPFTACGDHGMASDKIQFFRILKDRILVYFSLAAKGEPLDAQSFQLQRTP